MFVDDLKHQILDGEFSTQKTVEKGGYINNLVCPECGKTEAWAYSNAPFAIVCNRQNQCGARTKTIPLFNLSARIEQEYKPTKKDPNKPARAYLESRGISASLIEQLAYEYHPKTRKGCGGGVMFPVDSKEGKKLYNGRLINPPPGQGKTHNIGKISGHHWQMPDMKYDPEQPTYVTEGILDALSLITMGYQAIAVLGAGYDPKRFNLSYFGNLVFAFDADQAGAKFTRKWLDHFQSTDPEEMGLDISVIMPTKGDWNDLLCNAGSTEKAAKRFEKDFERYQLEGQLRLAETAQEYAETYVAGNKNFAPGLFIFNGYYYWSWVEKKGKGEGLKTFTDRASNFTIEVQHYQRSDADEELPVFLFKLKIKPKKGRPVYVTASGNDLKSADGLAGFFLRHGKVHWRGKIEAAKAFAEMIVDSKAPVVRQAEFIGYDHATGYHVLKDVTVDPKGRLIFPDKSGFFKVGQGEYLRPALIETIKPSQSDIPKLYNLLIAAWGGNAAMAIAFLAASMFVNRIKPVTKFFPFLSMHGDPQTGKSRLLMILNQMQCLDEEGIPISSANTKKGELRTLAQVSGMMKGLIEGNDPTKSRFDFESILPLYNHGNPLQVRALTTNDNRINKMAFHGTIAFAQNFEPFRSRAAKERIISLKFSIDDLNDHTKAAFERLASISPQEYAGFVVILKHRILIEGTWETKFKEAKADLLQEVPDNRINENHALILAFHRLLCDIFNIDHDLLPFVTIIGKEKMVSCQQRTLTAADYFFDALNELPEEIKGVEDLDYLENKNTFFEIRDNHIYLNRPGAEKAIRAAGMILDYPERIGASLQQHPAFVKGMVSHRFPGNRNKVIRALVFDIRRMND